MKIPKYIDEALRKRTRLANKLDIVCFIVDEWLDENDIDCEKRLLSIKLKYNSISSVTYCSILFIVAINSSWLFYSISTYNFNSNNNGYFH